MYDLLSWLVECSGARNLVRLDSCKAVFQKKANVTPRRASFPLPGSGDCSPGAKNSRHLAPPPEAARPGGLSSSSAVRGGGGRGSEKRNQRRRREFKGAREGEGDKEKGGGCALRPASLLGRDRRPWPLWGPCAGPRFLA